MECHFRNAMACMPQSWNWLEDRRSEADKVFRRVWKVVKAEVGKIGVEKKKEKERKKKERKKWEEKEQKKEERKRKSKIKG